MVIQIIRILICLGYLQVYGCLRRQILIALMAGIHHEDRTHAQSAVVIYLGRMN
jgi:hypothetical protein